MRRVGVAGAILVGILAVRCTLVTDLSGLSGGPSDASPEGAVPPGTPPPGTDGAANDGSTVDGGVTGCARFPGATFCNDFEAPNALATPPWSQLYQPVMPSSVTLVPGAANQGHAAHFDLGQNGTCAFINLYENFSGSFSAVTARISVKPEQTGIFLGLIATVTGKINYRTLVSFAPVSSGAFELYAFVQKADNGTFTEPGGEGSFTFPTSPIGTYHDVSIDYAVGPPQITVTVDGHAIPVAAPADFVLNDPYLAIGPYCRDKAMALEIDDVAVTTK